MTGKIIALEDVALSLGDGAARVDVLRGISLDVAEGEAVGLVGPSGSGKSTFLRCINFLEKPSEGSLFLFAGAEKVLFKKQVVAGDQLVLKSELVMQKRGIYKYNCIATVDGVVAASAEIMVSHQKIEQS